MASNGIRLLHLADIHIGMENYGQIDPTTGVNSRVMDFLRCFDEAVAYAVQNEVDLTIIAGDAYKTRDPNSTYRREFARRIKRLTDAEIPVVLLVGNHDLPSAARRASSISIFHTLQVPRVTVADGDELYRITTRRGVPVQVVAIPYPLRSRLMAHDEFHHLSVAELDNRLQALLTENLRALIAQLDPDVPAILTAHLSVSEAKQGSEKNVMIGRDVVMLKSVVADPAFDYVALGHIHKFQDLNRGVHPPVVYAGSIERIDFGEETEEKGFVIADIRRGETSYRFIPVSARRFLTIRVDVDQPDPTAQILEEIARHDVRGVVVRVLIRVDEERARLIQDKEIRRALAEAHYISAIHKEVERRIRQRLGGQSAEEMTPRELLQRYFQDRGQEPERIQLLLRYADQILKPET